MPNPYHDKHTGEFTSGPGGGGRFSGAASGDAAAKRRFTGSGRAGGYASPEEIASSRPVHARDEWKAGHHYKAVISAAARGGWTHTNPDTQMRETNFRKGEVGIYVNYGETGSISHAGMQNKRTMRPLALVSASTKGKANIVFEWFKH